MPRAIALRWRVLNALSGRKRVACQATVAPKSCPTTTALGASNSSSIRQDPGLNVGSVLIDRLRPIALALTTHIRGNRIEACIGERIDLVTPRIKAFRKAMAQQDKSTPACSITFRLMPLALMIRPVCLLMTSQMRTDVQHLTFTRCDLLEIIFPSRRRPAWPAAIPRRDQRPLGNLPAAPARGPDNPFFHPCSRSPPMIIGGWIQQGASGNCPRVN